MPKLLPNLQENILKCGREILLTEGYAELTMRKIAAKCGIAVGTIYRYYESKEYLSAAIMLEDWFGTIAHMKEETERADAPVDGLEAVFLSIRQYADVYRDTWKAFTGAGAVSEERHRLLIAQLVSVIAPLLERFEINGEPGLDRFLAETVLRSAAGQSGNFDEIRPFIKRLIL